MNIVILNGPPNCGKDYMADRLVSEFPGAVKAEFKWQLRRIVKLMYQLTDLEHDEMARRENKEKPQRKLDGKSLREAYIYISEVVVKPNFGHVYFGQAVANYLKDSNPETVIFSDGGFGPEILPLLGIADKILIVHMSADGCSFEGDSRNYINFLHSKIVTRKFHNHKNRQSINDLKDLINESGI